VASRHLASAYASREEECSDKDVSGDDLVAAVHAALDGRRYVSRALDEAAEDDATRDRTRRAW
jgi:hypothetical protein